MAETSAETGSREILHLTRRLARGDEDAFRAFHQLYFDRLYHFLLVVTRGQEQEAEEALQDTLLRVVRYARAFETEEVFWNWLKAVARSAARDVSRKHRRYLNLLRNFALQRESELPGAVDQEENRLRVLLEETLLRIDPADRELVEGKYLHGSTIRELAAVAGLTEKAVESRLLRSRRLIREFLMEKLKSS